MKRLLLEIGAEEIPAGYINPALTALSAMLTKKMSEARIEYGEAKTYGTPKRLVIEIDEVAMKQKAQTTEIIGPPENVGFDQQGNPTTAAEGFAEKVGVKVHSLKTKQTEKGSYLYVKKTERGYATKTILKDILPKVILSIPFPKSMRWSNLSIEFARPIFSIMALLGDQIIPFKIGNIKSGRYTFGHYFLGPKKIKIENPDSYIEQLRAAHVVADFKERKAVIEKEITEVAGKSGGSVLPDDELLDIVTNLVEYSVPVVGQFDEAFLEVPDEVLITAMREHQKYFAMIDSKNNLMPSFIAVNNTPVRDLKLVAKGHERVLRARLKDAQFFYKSDMAASMDGWVERLKGVLFQAQLGTMYEKIIRVQKLSEYLSDSAGLPEEIKIHSKRAAYLCKADLVSQVVVEFPKLQGVMGRVYAGEKGEHKGVSSAIEEHYRPVYSGAPLPETNTGSIVSIADKLDSICGCFSVGLVPTGTSDPYALRRQGIGIAQMMLEKNFSFSLKSAIENSLKLFGQSSTKSIGKTAGKIHDFLIKRLAHIMFEEGYSKDVIAAVTHTSVDNIPDLWNRVRALQKLKEQPDFQPLAISFKRVVNIIKKSRDKSDGKINTDLFEDSCEFSLYTALQTVEKRVTLNLSKGLFENALIDVASLRDGVDSFFDGVMVMTEDERIRNNRFALLKRISDLFYQFADFSMIST